MKIFIYGDSNVWGYQKVVKSDGSMEVRQLPENERWVGILAQKIPTAKIVADGKNSRVAGNESDNQELRGRQNFEHLLARDFDYDLVIIALGTNDLKLRYGLTPEEIAQNILWYHSAIRDKCSATRSKILFILPPNFAPKHDGMQDETRREVNEIVAQNLSESEYIVVNYLDLSADGMHLSPRGHRRLAEMVYSKIFGVNRGDKRSLDER